MIDRVYGKQVPTCDGCGDTLPPQETFQDALDAIKEEGWASDPVNGEFENYCKECKEA